MSKTKLKHDHLVEISAAKYVFGDKKSLYDLSKCTEWSDLFKKWTGFYETLKSEMEKPISTRIKTFVKFTLNNSDK